MRVMLDVRLRELSHYAADGPHDFLALGEGEGDGRHRSLDEREQRFRGDRDGGRRALPFARGRRTEGR